MPYRSPHPHPTPSRTLDTRTWVTHRWRNTLQSLALVLAMAGVLAAIGWLVAGMPGLLGTVMALVVGCALSPNLAPRWVMQAHGARELSRRAAPELHQTVARLAERAGLARAPSLHYLAHPSVNAFAVGRRDRAAIAISAGLLQVLSRRELVGVLAHELSHVRNADTWLLGLTALFARITRMLSRVGQLLLLVNLPLLALGAAAFDWIGIAALIGAPGASALLHLALSRTREFDADLGAVALTGDPLGLASALQKLSRIERGWFTRVFELRGKADNSLLRTHPPTRERIRRLEALRPDVPMARAGWTSRGD